MMGKQLLSALLLSAVSSFTFAEDITGLWQSIDDKTKRMAPMQAK